MATFEDYLFVKNTRWFVWGALGLLLAALIFHAGVVVGSHSRVGQRGPAMGFEARIPLGGIGMMLPQGFMPGAHGALGTIATITLPMLTLTSRDGTTLEIELSSSTLINGTMGSAAPTLHVGDTVIVIGDPNDTDDHGEVDARLIRVITDAAPQQ